MNCTICGAETKHRFHKAPICRLCADKFLEPGFNPYMARAKMLHKRLIKDKEIMEATFAPYCNKETTT